MRGRKLGLLTAGATGGRIIRGRNSPMLVVTLKKRGDLSSINTECSASLSNQLDPGHLWVDRAVVISGTAGRVEEAGCCRAGRQVLLVGCQDLRDGGHDVAAVTLIGGVVLVLQELVSIRVADPLALAVVAVLVEGHHVPDGGEQIVLAGSDAERRLDVQEDVADLDKVLLVQASKGLRSAHSHVEPEVKHN